MVEFVVKKVCGAEGGAWAVIPEMQVAPWIDGSVMAVCGGPGHEVRAWNVRKAPSNMGDRRPAGREVWLFTPRGHGHPPIEGEELHRRIDIGIAETEASCMSAPPPPAIDVVTLSAGLPDGVYYAGKRFHRVSEEDRKFWWSATMDGLRAGTADTRRRRDEIGRRIGSQTIVIRWTIEDGQPSAPEKLENQTSDGVTPKGETSFDWGPSCNLSDLAYALAVDVDRRADDTNACARAMWLRLRALGDEWVVPQRDLQIILAAFDIGKAVRGAWERDVPVDEARQMLEREVRLMACDVVVAVVRDKDGRFLAVSRKDDHADMGFPGGKRHPGEWPIDAVQREVLEETGFTCQVGKLIRVGLASGRDHVGIVCAAFAVHLGEQGERAPGETGRVDWVTREELLAGSFGEHVRAIFAALDAQEGGAK